MAATMRLSVLVLVPLCLATACQNPYSALADKPSGFQCTFTRVTAYTEAVSTETVDWYVCPAPHGASAWTWTDPTTGQVYTATVTWH